MQALALLLVITSTIVLRSGDAFTVEGPIREANGVLTFRSGGALYSLAAEEVERIEEARPSEPQPAVAPEAPSEPRLRLRVSEEERKRLLEELEKNHSGAPAPRQKILEELPAEPTPVERRERRRDESIWRNRARAYEENLIRAREELALLESRVDELESKIHSLIALGYKPQQFSYDSTQLIRTREQIPHARLQVTRAERALAQFREDARREGILPGWLR